MTASSSAPPQWLRIPQAVQLYGVGKSTLYVLIAEGKIRSSLVSAAKSNAKEGKRHGTRLVSAASLESYLSSHATGGEAQAPAKKGGRRG